ncbi:MAG: hypothetical protein K2X81_26965 [Candidatus Obscuribacterales bacterium]|nr:hypothetical protein [Candidatus Obscuribacterales bacterium]
MLDALADDLSGLLGVLRVAGEIKETLIDAVDLLPVQNQGTSKIDAFQSKIRFHF